MSGPLSGFQIIELAGLGPAPFCGMVLADLGAEVVRVDRTTRTSEAATPPVVHDVLNRGKRSIGVNLKDPAGVEVVLDLVAEADGLIEGFRPGVTERLGLGPAPCLARNQKLVYGRMTGWGQDGPMSGMAGHDIDYIAISGVLGSVGYTDGPVPPLNLVGDFGGGGMLLTVGMLAAILRARSSGEGQVVDAAMVDGAALLMASHHGFVADGWWNGNQRESNLLDGGAPFYTTYRTSDNRFVAVGALEPQFFGELLEKLGLVASELPPQLDRKGWPELREAFGDVFVTRSREEWSRVFEGSDACVAPVLSMSESAEHSHLRARSTFTIVDGVVQPSTAPRFSATPAHIDAPPASPGEHSEAILVALGYTSNQIGMLRDTGTVV